MKTLEQLEDLAETEWVEEYDDLMKRKYCNTEEDTASQQQQQQQLRTSLLCDDNISLQLDDIFTHDEKRVKRENMHVKLIS